MKSIKPPGVIEYIGEAAHELLTLQSRGKILAVVSQAAYLLNEKGELFWLGTENVPMHRRGIRLSGLFPRLSVEAPYAIKDQHLIFGPRIALDFSAARIWETPPLPPGGILPVADLPQRLRAVSDILDDLPVPAGFGGLIPDLLIIVQSKITSHPRHIQTGIQAHAWPAVKEIATACLAHDFPKITDQACFLAGLGEGLTPSGDDFIGGLLFCRKILQNSYGNILNLEFPNLTDFFEKTRNSTNIISYAFLKDHAEGWGFEPLHQFASAFLSGKTDRRLQPIADDLIHIGHSTGWDLLTGFLTGILLAFDA